MQKREFFKLVKVKIEKQVSELRNKEQKTMFEVLTCVENKSCLRHRRVFFSETTKSWSESEFKNKSLMYEKTKKKTMLYFEQLYSFNGKVADIEASEL